MKNIFAGDLRHGDTLVNVLPNVEDAFTVMEGDVPGYWDVIVVVATDTDTFTIGNQRFAVGCKMTGWIDKACDIPGDYDVYRDGSLLSLQRGKVSS